MRKKEICRVVVACLLIMIVFSTATPSFPQSSDSNSPFEKMYCKKIIIRDDDVDAREHRDPSICLKWLTNLTLEKNIRVTYGVIVVNETFSDNMVLVDYLNNLDKTHFEIATHGYTHEHFKEIPYDEQYSRIENATKTIESYLHIKPYTFITPFSSDDENTSKVCEALGYHSFSSCNVYPNDNVIDFGVDVCLEYNWSQSPPEHRSFNSLKHNFDDFYNSTDEYYVLCMHHNTFWYENKTALNETRVSNFENFVDYMKTKNVEFMTIEGAYEWHVDKDRITHNQTDNGYMIDFGDCEYNHTVKFASPEDWEGKKITVFDITANSVIGEYSANYFEFTGVKGHCYEISVKKENEINDNLQYGLMLTGVAALISIVCIYIYYKHKKKIAQ